MYYLLNWNDEYLDNIIVAARETKEEIREALKERVLSRLVELNIADDTEEAEVMWAENGPGNNGYSNDGTLSINSLGASILYGDSYTDYYHIVEFHTDTLKAFQRAESDDYFYLIGTDAMTYSDGDRMFQYVPAVTFDLQPDEETIVATLSAVILPEYFHPDVLKYEVLYPGGMEDVDPKDVTALDLVREKAPLIILSHDEFTDTGDAWDEMEPVQDFLNRATEAFSGLNELVRERMAEAFNKIGTPYEALVDHILHNAPLF